MAVWYPKHCLRRFRLAAAGVFIHDRFCFEIAVLLSIGANNSDFYQFLKKHQIDVERNFMQNNCRCLS